MLISLLVECAYLQPFCLLSKFFNCYIFTLTRKKLAIAVNKLTVWEVPYDTSPTIHTGTHIELKLTICIFQWAGRRTWMQLLVRVLSVPRQWLRSRANSNIYSLHRSERQWNKHWYTINRQSKLCILYL